MDGEAGQRKGEDVAAACPVINAGDTVTFKAKGAHGDHGVVRDPEEELEQPDKAPDGCLAVLCVDGTLVYAAVGDLTVSDRSHLYPGQLVVSASDPGGQIGIVMEAATTLDLVQLGNGNNGGEPVPVAKGVSPAEVRRVREFSVGDYVVSGTWLGRVQEVSLDVDVRFDDGAVCRVAFADGKLALVGEHINETFRPQNNSRCYPGLRVSPATDNLSVFESSRWLTGGWSPAHGEGTVANVEMAAVHVDWVASATMGTELDLVRASAPPAYQPNPRLLSRFGSTNGCHWGWGVADRCFLRGSTTANMGSSSSSSIKIERPVSVADTRTTVDVVWQDGTWHRGVPSASLIPFDLLNDFEFFPGDRVVIKSELLDNDDSPATTTDDVDDDEAVRFGIVRSFDYMHKTVHVSWFKTAARHEEECDETVSAYDMELDHDHMIFHGYIVIRLQPASDDDDDTMPPEETRKEAADDLSWVGYVIGLCDHGRIQVRWGNNTTSKVLRHEIIIVDSDAEYEAQEGMNEESAVTDTGHVITGDEEDNNGGDAATAILEPGALESAQMPRGYCYDETEVISLPPNRCDDEDVYGDASAGKENKAAIVATSGNDFPQFDVVRSPPDHSFIDDTKQGIGGGKKWIKRVQKEWKILKHDLPDTIHVRAFEDRMDLLRVAMVGVAGTPYQDGLFFFDMQLPPTYPAVPPQVQYRSFGLNLNPNLDESGTVCLSLLDTFGGEGVELWSPAMSTILQVVVSIQGLVLKSQPFYNEYSFEEYLGTPNGARNEIIFTEDAYLLTLRTMIHLLRRPPVGFEELVQCHFRRRGRFVLRACTAYLREACPVGTLDEEANTTEEVRDGRTCSAGFRLALARFMPRLVEAFTTIGAKGCEQFNRFSWSDLVGAPVH